MYFNKIILRLSVFRDLVKKLERVQGDGVFDATCQNLCQIVPLFLLGVIPDVEITGTEILRVIGQALLVDVLLADTDDEEYRQIAENVAHYHHERVDGSGYPDGLRGDEIPLEARIMAIADVYDALVSKRVYKESYSFEKADRIILDGMGTQFDPQLETYYEAARPKLEAYYAQSS
jgi:hypothetical protein